MAYGVGAALHVLKARTFSYPLDEPIPYDLIERIVKLRVIQDAETAATKRKKRK